MNDQTPGSAETDCLPGGLDPARGRPESGTFRSPYCDWTPARLLEHFQSRRTVRWFAVRDPEQAGDDKIDGVLVNRFEFNHEAHPLPRGFDWRVNPSRDAEWFILLHKFYFAVGLGERYRQSGDAKCVSKWIELTESWIDTIPVDFLPNDVTGRRVQNWIYAYFHFIQERPAAELTPEFHLKFLVSLHGQVSHLSRHLTIARNHRTIELCALFLAAVVFPEFAEAERWLETARQELLQNIRRDLLPDGVHCELSTDYHHLVLKNYLNARTLARLNGIAMPAELDELLRKALEFAVFAHRPDGTIPSLSDGDSRSFLEVIRQGHELFNNEEWLYVATQGRQGRPPARRSRVFPSSGYAIQRSGWGEGGEAFEQERYLIFDCGPLGEGNHGHLDLLSFEMAAYGQPLVVDPGRYTYHEPAPETGEINWRARFRGTAYHNTVQIDGKNQARYEFEKRRCKILGPGPDYELRTFRTADEYDFVHGIARSHEYPVVHERKILFIRPDYWIVSDLLHAAEFHAYDLRFHFSDQAQGKTEIETVEGTRLVHAPHLVLAQPTGPGGEASIEEGFISRTYGVKCPAPVLRVRRTASSADFHTVLYPYRRERPEIRMEILPVECGDRNGPPNGAFALAVTVTSRGQRWRDIYFCADDTADREYRAAGIVCRSSPFLVRQPLTMEPSPRRERSDW
jgi:hypothetical protein